MKLLNSATETLAEQRRVQVIASTDSEDRVGDVIVQSGIDLAAYKKNPMVLWGHDPDVPVARAIDIGVVGGKLQATVQFPDEGIDADSDWVYGKIKSGIVNAVSVGFIPLDYEPLDPKTPWGGYRFLKSELLEFSFVSIPANRDCLVIGRDIIRGQSLVPPSKKGDEADWKCGASRDLPIDEEGSWDGPAAEAAIFSHAGGDDFDPAIASKGFLAYDASKPKLRGSYKLPFATVENGTMKAKASGIRAAASRLPDTDIPDGVKGTARGVIDHYESKMKKAMGEGSGSAGAVTVPDGNCGREKDMECGMKDPQECAIHYSPDEGKAFLDACHTLGLDPKAVKAGRVISAKNKALLEKAMEHHGFATKCIKDVLDGDGESGDGDPNENDKPNPVAGHDPNDLDINPVDPDPEKQRALRIAAAKKLKESLTYN